MAKAYIAKIQSIEPIMIKGEEASSIHLATVMGEKVVVSKNWNVGFQGVFFPPDTQLSEDFCHHNNLYRNAEKNIDTTKTGFFEENRRVRCQPFCGAKSEGFFAGVESLEWTGYLDQLKEGEVFDVLNGQPVCKKYYNERTLKALKNKQKNGQKKEKQVSTPLFNTHVDTDNFNYYVGSIKKGMVLSFHAKVHGTSFRVANTKIVEKPTGIKSKVNSLFGKDVFKKKERWEYIAGSRRVTLFEDKDKNKEGFHGSEAYRFEVLDAFKGHLEKGMTVYGEIAGYVNGKPIMGTHDTEVLKDKEFTKKYGKTVTYTYGCKETEYRFHVYRITYTSDEGTEIDFTDQQVMKWCEDHAFLPPVEVHEPLIYDGDEEKLKTLVEGLTERPEVLCEDYIDPSHVSEGIIVRCDRAHLKPKFYKSKSYAFKVMEGIVKEKEVDIEDAS